MIEVVLSLGSNDVGKRHKNVLEAQEWLRSLLEVDMISSVYETPPVGHSGSNYVNCVVRGVFNGNAKELERKCKEYELAQGRNEHTRRLALVPIDIDIVMAQGQILREKDFNSMFFQIGYKELI